MSEGFDWGPVDAKYAEFMELGITDTWSARFLSSVVTSRLPPRGGGIPILEEILKTDLAAVRADLARLTPLQGRAGVDEEWLAGVIHKVKNGKPLQAWHFQRLTSIEEKAASPAEELPDHMYDLVNNIKILAGRRSAWYWGQRSGQYRRMRAIFNAAEVRQGLQVQDVEWLTTLFKGDLAELHSTKHKVGDLCYLRTGEMAMVVSDPYISSDHRCVVLDVLVNGTKSTLPATNLLKRKTKKENN